MKFHSVIFARGGSKGLPRKNLLELCGKPLIGWAVEQARAVPMIDRVIVSTDCEKSLLLLEHMAQRFRSCVPKNWQTIRLQNGSPGDMQWNF